jgi:hypothetical protein
VDHSSCWVRTIHQWTGSHWGQQHIPRVGAEVAVSFLGGDPDRPVIVGELRNVLSPPPFSLPEHKTRSGWRTQSVPDGGFHELEIRSTRTFDLAFLNGLNRLERLTLADVSVVDPSALNALRGLRACRVAVELTADVTDMGYTSAEKTISDLETFFSRRKCPRHGESGCSTEGPYVRLH